jgi:hypothetical protein
MVSRVTLLVSIGLAVVGLAVSGYGTEAQAEDCQWYGTAPFCDGSCPDDRYQVRRARGKCITGHKVYCCVVPVDKATTPTAKPKPKPLFDDEAICNAYAMGAVQDFYAAKRNSACGVEADARWHPKRALHFNWCMQGGDTGSENTARKNILVKCGEVILPN